MKKYMPASLMLLFFAIALWVSCEKLETYSPIPEVEFKSVYIADTLDANGNKVKLQRLNITITDGDGNYGLRQSDTVDTNHPDSLHYHNLFIKMFAKNGEGSFDELTDLNQNCKYRVPYKESIGQNKYLKADVTVKMEPFLGIMDYDSIRYEIMVYDQDLTPSETITTCSIPLRRHGTTYANGNGKYAKEEAKKE